MKQSSLLPEHVASFNENGFVVVKSLFSADEVAKLREHFMALRAKGPYPLDMVGVDTKSTDPLLKFPRMIHMHRWDTISRKWLIDARLNECLTGLFGSEPYAVQSMLYFKPAGARGQAMHQDNFYLRAKPGTCMAAWMALDDTDEANGCMQLVPGSHRWPILCTAPADTTRSFTDVTVPLPEGTKITPVKMQAGDVLFFHGATVHGSLPNTSTDRFRRSLIGHYVAGEATAVTKYDQPVLRMNGTEWNLDHSPEGGSCGQWVSENGEPVIEMVASGHGTLKDHE